MKWVGHVAHMQERRNAFRILVGKLKGTDHLEDLDPITQIRLTMEKDRLCFILTKIQLHAVIKDVICDIPGRP
jgi:hypothetical protein